MARLAFHGYEQGTLATLAQGASSSMDRTSAGSGTGVSPTVQGTVVRSGSFAMKCDSGAGSATCFATTNPAAVTTYPEFFKEWFCFADLPDSSAKIMVSGPISVRITSGGKLQLWNDTAGTQIGSDSAATIVADGATFWKIAFSVTSNGSNTTAAELQVIDVSVASATGLAIGLPTTLTHGWVTSPGANKVLYCDDCAINDSAGANENTWPGDGKIVLLVPISLNANGGSWTTSGGGTTSALLAAAVDNTPPVGVADTTANEGHQVRNAAANTSIDFNLTDYATAGVGASDTINVLSPMVNVGAPVSTGGKSGSFGILSNPTIAQRAFAGGSGTPAFFWRGTAAGTYPTGWGWEIGTITYAPTVTPGTSPVARLSITAGTASRIALSDFVGMYVDYTPAAVAPPASLVVDTRRGSRNNALLRRMQALLWNRRPSGILVPDRRILLPQPVI